MPRFFFDVQDGDLLLDYRGQDLSTLDAAYAHAITLAEAMARAREQNEGIPPWHVMIKNSKGELQATVTLVRC